MTFDPNDHGYVASRPTFTNFEGDRRHDLGNITERARRPLTFKQFDHLMREVPSCR